MAELWSLSAFGEELVLELTVRERFVDPPFTIDQVMVGDLEGLGLPESVCAPADFEDAICYQSDAAKWANVLGSAGVMSVGGGGSSLWCSASNISADNKILTNHHCVANQSECDNAEFVFNHYNTTCGGSTLSGWVSFRCDETLVVSPLGGCEATPSTLDFSLHSVIGDPASTYGHVTPDPTPLVDGEAIYIVQHPSGRPHEITHGEGANVDVDGNNLRYYDTLDTEGGSSGSPIYRDADDKLVGLHHCGGCTTPGVGNRGMLMSDIYPLIEPFLANDEIFADGFESGDTSGWSSTSP